MTTLPEGGRIRVPLYFVSDRQGESVQAANGLELFFIARVAGDLPQGWLEVTTVLPQVSGLLRPPETFSTQDFPDPDVRWNKARDWCAYLWSQFLANTCDLEEVQVRQQVRG